MTDSPSVTWPSPARTTLPLRRIDKTVVERISRFVDMGAILDYSSADGCGFVRIFAFCGGRKRKQVPHRRDTRSGTSMSATGGVAAAVAVRDPEVKGKVYLKSEVKINGQECAFYTSETDGVGNLALG